MKNLKLALFGLFLTGAVSAQNTGKITLTTGQKFNIASVVKTHSVSSMMGQEVVNDMDLSSTYQITVNNASGGNYDLTGVLSRMAMSMSVMGQEMKFDSDNPDDSSNPLADGMDEVLNKPQTFTIDQQGQVVKAANAPGSSPILEEMQSNAVGSRAAFLPVSPNMKAGDTFDVNDSDSATGTTSAIKYTVQSINGINATLAFKGTVKAKKTVEQQGMQIDTETSGDIEGKTIVNTKTGIIQSSTSKSKQTGTVGVMGQQFPITVEVDTNVTVSESK